MQLNKEAFTKSSIGNFYLYTGDRLDNAVQGDIRENGSFDLLSAQWMLDNIKPGSVCYDIGANVFQMSYAMAIAAKSNGAVYAFEPQERLVKAFNYGKQLSKLVDTAEIYAYPLALSNKKASMSLKIPVTNIGAATLSQNKMDALRVDWTYAYDSVRVDRLDVLDLPAPDFIKLDIEGHEAEAWIGFPQSAKECPLILAELGTYTEEWLIDEYLSFGRKAYTIYGESLKNDSQGIMQYLKEHPWQQDNIVFRRD